MEKPYITLFPEAGSMWNEFNKVHNTVKNTQEKDPLATTPLSKEEIAAKLQAKRDSDGKTQFKNAIEKAELDRAKARAEKTPITPSKPVDPTDIEAIASRYAKPPLPKKEPLPQTPLSMGSSTTSVPDETKVALDQKFGKDFRAKGVSKASAPRSFGGQVFDQAIEPTEITPDEVGQIQQPYRASSKIKRYAPETPAMPAALDTTSIEGGAEKHLSTQFTTEPNKQKMPKVKNPSVVTDPKKDKFKSYKDLTPEEKEEYIKNMAPEREVPEI